MADEHPKVDTEKEDDHHNPYSERLEKKRLAIQTHAARAHEQRSLADPERFENWVVDNPVPSMWNADAVRRWNLKRLDRLRR